MVQPIHALQHGPLHVGGYPRSVLLAAYWQHWAMAVAEATLTAAASWAPWVPSQDYQWANDLMQQVHLPREVLSDSAQQLNGLMEVADGPTLTLRAQPVLTLRAEASSLQVGYEYLLGGWQLQLPGASFRPQRSLPNGTMAPPREPTAVTSLIGALARSVGSHRCRCTGGAPS